MEAFKFPHSNTIYNWSGVAIGECFKGPGGKTVVSEHLLVTLLTQGMVPEAEITPVTLPLLPPTEPQGLPFPTHLLLLDASILEEGIQPHQEYELAEFIPPESTTEPENEPPPPLVLAQEFPDNLPATPPSILEEGTQEYDLAEFIPESTTHDLLDEYEYDHEFGATQEGSEQVDDH